MRSSDDQPEVTNGNLHVSPSSSTSLLFVFDRVDTAGKHAGVGRKTALREDGQGV